MEKLFQLVAYFVVWTPVVGYEVGEHDFLRIKEKTSLSQYHQLKTRSIITREKTSKYVEYLRYNYDTFFKGYQLLSKELKDLPRKRSTKRFEGRSIDSHATFKSFQPATNADRDEILKGVKAVGVSGTTIGLFDVFGYKAFPILAGTTLYHDLVAAAAAANFEKGKVVVFGHERFTQLVSDQADTDKLFLNSLKWASRKKSLKKKAGVLKGEKSTWTDDIIKFLNESSFDGQIITPNDLENQTDVKIEDMDILIFPSFYDVKQGAVERIKAYVKNGGGFVSGYKFTDSDFVGNEILRPMGIIHIPDDEWLRVWLIKMRPTKMFTVSNDVLTDAHSGWDAKNIIEMLKSNTSVEDVKTRWNHMSDIVRLSLEFSNQSDLEWLDEFKAEVIWFFMSGRSMEKTKWKQILNMLKLIFPSDTKWLEKLTESIMQLFKGSQPIENSLWEQISDTLKYSIKYTNRSNLNWLDELVETNFQLSESGKQVPNFRWESSYIVLKYSINDVNMSDLTWPEKFKTSTMKLIEEGKVNLTDSEWNHIIDVLQISLRYDNESRLGWLDKFKEIIISRSCNISEEKPLKNTPVHRFYALVEHSLFNALLEPEQMYIHPSAVNFPGMPDKSTDKERKKTHVVTIPLANNPAKPIYNWDAAGVGFSTRLYAPPGSVISLKIKGEVAFKFQFKIGCHRDNLIDLEEWLRFPRIIMGQYFDGNSASMASPFGGLIYVQDIKALTTNITVTNLTCEITGAILTPSFVLDQTALIDWKESIRFIKAPWADLVSDKNVISISEKMARSLENPEEILLYWKNSVNQMSDFVNIGRQNNFQSFAYDVHISAGYMHSGSPIMGYIGAGFDMLNTKLVCTDTSTVYFHEMGHNLQYRHGRSWTLEMENEVTNELFSRYIYNVFCPLPLEESGRGNDFHLTSISSGIEKYIASGGKYSEDFGTTWEIFYYQIAKNFGWGTFRRVFKEYPKLPEYPSNGDEIMNTRFVLFSIAAKRNLAGLYKSWGLPFSSEAAEKVSHLPDATCVMTDLLIKHE